MLRRTNLKMYYYILQKTYQLQGAQVRCANLKVISLAIGRSADSALRPGVQIGLRVVRPGVAAVGALKRVL